MRYCCCNPRRAWRVSGRLVNSVCEIELLPQRSASEWVAVVCWLTGRAQWYVPVERRRRPAVRSLRLDTRPTIRPTTTLTGRRCRQAPLTVSRLPTPPATSMSLIVRLWRRVTRSASCRGRAISLRRLASTPGSSLYLSVCLSVHFHPRPVCVCVVCA